MKGKRDTRVVPPFPESPRYVSPFQGNLFSLHCPTFKPRIDSTHSTVARGISLCESLVGKPRGKSSWEILKGKPQIP